MKLRNKKTGKVIDINLSVDMLDEDYIIEYGTLEEFNSDWEDYDEPKEHWYISADGDVRSKPEHQFCDPVYMEIIGNYFETEEEAEKAVEKLKSWKRLKDHNLRVERGQRIFVNADNKLTSQKPLFVVDTYGEVEDDLDLLFGGEE